MLELLDIFVDNIAPILIIAFIGFAIGKRFGIDPAPVSTLIFYVLSPSFVFFLLYTSDISGGEFLTLFGATFLFQGSMLTLAFTVLRFQRVTPVQRANVMLSAFCLNAGNFGLSLAAFAFDTEVLSRAVAVFLANVTLNYTLGVYVASNGRSSPLQALSNVARTPAIYGLLAAFALRALEVSRSPVLLRPIGDLSTLRYDQTASSVLPLVLERSIETLSGAAIPMMLLMLGLQLGRFAGSSRLTLVGTGVVLKLLVAPVVALGISVLLALSGPARTAFIVQASMPTAVLTIVLSTEFDLDRDLALNLIMVSTLLSPLTLSVLILLLR